MSPETESSLNIDDKDLEILKILQTDCRKSISEIADKVNMPKSTVFNRIKRLEENKVITGYSAIIDPAKLGFDLHIIINIRAKYGKKYKDRIGEALAKIPGVWGVFFVFGDQDFIVHAYSRNRQELIQKIETLTEMEEIERTSSVIVGEVMKLDLKVDFERM